MKTLIASLAIAGSLSALGAEPKHDVAIKDIKVEVIQSPQYSVSGTGSKRTDNRYWIEIEAELQTQTNHPNGFIPELQVEWYAIIQDQFHVEGGKIGPKAKMLTGTATFKNIRAKDGTAYLSAYIEPDELEKLTGQEKPQPRVVMAAALVVSGTNVTPNPKLLQKAIGVNSDSAASESPWWKRPDMIRLEGLILPKSKTPFAPLWSGRYPLEMEKE